MRRTNLNLIEESLKSKILLSPEKINASSCHLLRRTWWSLSWRRWETHMPLYLFGMISLSCVGLILITLRFLSFPMQQNMHEHRMEHLSVVNNAWERIVNDNRAIDRLSKTQSNRTNTKGSMNASNSTKIPKVAHFVFFSAKSGDLYKWGSQTPKTFSLINYLVLRAAFHNLRPNAIFFYCDVEPVGPFWDLSKPLIQIIRVPRITNIFGHAISSVEHMSDVLRLRVLMQHGGAYFDTDIILLQSFDHIFEESSGFVMGEESGVMDNGKSFEGLCNAVIISNPKSGFLRRWYKSYTTFEDSEWSSHSVALPLKLSRTTPKEITVLGNRRFYWPLWTTAGLKMLFQDNDYDFEQNYGVHLWGKVSWQDYVSELSFQRIMSIDTSFHRVLRPLLPHPLFSIHLLCKIAEEASAIKKTLLSIVSQDFQLYEIIIGDSSDQHDCSKLIRQYIIPMHTRLQMDNTVFIVTLKTTTKRTVEDAMMSKTRGAWKVQIIPGDMMPSQLLLEAQDYLVHNPRSYLSDVEKFKNFHFNSIDIPSDQHISQALYRYGPYPELNPATNVEISTDFLLVQDCFSLVILAGRETSSDSFVLNQNNSKLLKASSKVEKLHSDGAMNLRRLWPGKISAAAYRNVLFGTDSFHITHVSEYNQVIESWKICSETRRPVVVLESSCKILSIFDETFTAAMRDLSLDFGIMYFGSTQGIYQMNTSNDLEVFSIHPQLLLSIRWDAYILSPRMAEILLSDVYTIEANLTTYLFQKVRKYNFGVYRTRTPLIWNEVPISSSPSSPPKIFVPKIVHIIHLNADSAWKEFLPVTSSSQKTLLSGSLHLPQKQWVRIDSVKEGSLLDKFEWLVDDPLFTVKLLYFKLIVLCRYGGILLDAGLYSRHVEGLVAGGSPFLAYMDFDSQAYATVFPMMMGPPNHPDFVFLRDRLKNILQSDEDDTTMSLKTQEVVLQFMNQTTSPIPEGAKVVSFPLGIMLE